jgi:hypothetical protein
MAQTPPFDIRRNLPAAQQFTQRLADQFNADEQRFRDSGMGIELCEKLSGKGKRKRRKKSSSSTTVRLSADIGKLICAFAPVVRRAEASGIFTDCRELLACASCGLRENVLITGQLITYRGEDLESDTGLRFKEIGKGRFRCPYCQATVKEPVQ